MSLIKAVSRLHWHFVCWFIADRFQAFFTFIFKKKKDGLINAVLDWLTQVFGYAADCHGWEIHTAANEIREHRIW